MLVAGKLGALGPGAGCDGPIAKIARDLRVTGLGPAGVTLVDFKAGFEDTARGAITPLDWALAVVDPTSAAVQMAVHLARMVRAIRGGVPPATRHLESRELAELAIRLFRQSRVRGVGAVLNRVADPETETYLRAALAEGDVPVLGALEEDARIQAQWLRGDRVRSDRLLPEAVAVAQNLEAAEERWRSAGETGGSAGRPVAA